MEFQTTITLIELYCTSMKFQLQNIFSLVKQHVLLYFHKNFKIIAFGVTVYDILEEYIYE